MIINAAGGIDGKCSLMKLNLLQFAQLSRLRITAVAQLQSAISDFLFKEGYFRMNIKSCIDEEREMDALKLHTSKSVAQVQL